MRMSDRIVRGGGIRIQGNHAVWAAVVQLVDLVEFQLNPKRPQRDIFQRDGFGEDRDGVFRLLELDVTELIFKLPELFDDQSQFRGLFPRRLDQLLGFG